MAMHWQSSSFSRGLQQIFAFLLWYILQISNYDNQASNAANTNMDGNMEWKLGIPV